MGFEPTRAEPNGLAVHRINQSATSSCVRASTKWYSNDHLSRFCDLVQKPDIVVRSTVLVPHVVKITFGISGFMNRCWSY